ncbi:MAG: winged helix-turn-helix domain-containing protein [Gammaproteobacteria bacterium]|nr:winged helix-turn-helix domain-containing protein [Gammaproteobacteria bacterium]MDH5240927.1 winged helix-turn-helix domain-containing protein [Gammaproteobacteria bacterium]
MDSDLLKGFYLGELLIEPLKGQVTGRAGSRHLPPKAVEVLLCLAESPGELVTREKLLDAVWGQGQGSQEALGHAVSEIRHALDDHVDDPQYIQTLPKRGYRLLLDPVPVDTTSLPEVPGTNFWEALLRHGVVQASVAYLVVGWLLIQVADATFVDIGLPAWSKQFVTFVVIGGFPLLILLTWFLDFVGGRIASDDGAQPSGILHGLERNYFAIFIAYIIAAVGAATYQATVGFELPQTRQDVVALNAAEPDLVPVVENSLAVLQLLNIEGDAKTQVFSDGLSEDILDGLARIPGLLVSSRGDSWSLPPNAASDIVRRRLRVASYLEGSVRFVSDKLRVVVQLIDTESGFHLFSRNFELQIGDIGEMQKEVTSLVVANLKLAVDTSSLEDYFDYSSTPSEDAYFLYLSGREALRRPSSPANATEAIAYYDQALMIDEQYPAALAGRCDAFIALYQLQQDTSNVALAESACAKALAVAPRLPMVQHAVARLYRITGRYSEAEAIYTSNLQANPQDVVALEGLALIRRRQQEFDEAERLMRESILLQPGNWQSINTLGNMYFGMGRYVEAVAEYRKVVFLDPGNFVALGNLASANLMTGGFAAARDALLKSIAIEESDILYANLGIALYYLGDYDGSVAAHRRSVKLAPSSSGAWIGLADALYCAGHRDEAARAYASVIDLSRKQLEVNSDDIESMTFLAWASAMTGLTDDALALVSRAVELDPADPYSHYFDALVKLKSGLASDALAALELAVEAGYPVAMLAAEPILKELRQDSRFVSLLASNRPAEGEGE